MRTTTKVLKFPLSGVARDLDYRKAYIPSEETTFATPFAVNVRGTATFEKRMRGGSRPGLVRVSVGTNTRINLPHEHPIISGLASITPTTTCIYRARHCCAEGVAWYMSAIGDTDDWEFNGDAENPSRAASGSVELAGRIGETITALMPIRDDYLFIATRHSLWCLTGDPIGGTLRCVSEYVGCVSQDAWCFDGARIFTIGDKGLYAFAIGETPILISQKIPEELTSLSSAQMIFDADENAVHIFGNIGSNASDWFFDVDNKAFWRMGFTAAHRPLSVGYTMVDGIERVILLGSDSIWRRFEDSADDDDGADFLSEVAIGPIRCSDRDDVDGMVAEVVATSAKGSCDIGCAIYTAHSPEEAVDAADNMATTPFEFSVKAGWNNVVRPAKRGAWAVFVLSANGKWGFESMTAIFKALGRLR